MTEAPVFFDKTDESDPKDEQIVRDEAEQAEIIEPTTPTKPDYEIQKPNLVLPGLILLFIFSVILGTGYLMIRNRLYKSQLSDNLNKPKFGDLVPDKISPDSSPSSTIRPSVNVSYAPGLVDGGTTGGTKGGVVVTPTPTPTPIVTVTPTPTKKPAVKGDSTTKTNTQNSNSQYLTKVYFDAQYPYRISFNDSWGFVRTFGAGTGSNNDQILSGIELNRGNNKISANLLRGRGISDIATWIKDTPYSEAPTSGGENTSFKGNSAIKYTYRLSDGREVQKIYFIKGATVYRLVATYENSLSSEAQAILNSFIPDTN
jgi:hypothetical protein